MADSQLTPVARFGLCLREASPLPILLFLTNPALILMGSETYRVSAEVWLNLLSLTALSIVIVALFLYPIVSKNLATSTLRALFLAAFLITIFYPEGGRRLDGVEAVQPTEHLRFLYALFFMLVAGLVFILQRRPDIGQPVIVLAILCSMAVPAYIVTTRLLTLPERSQKELKISYSRASNVIFIVADMLQGSTVEQILVNNPRLQKSLGGFTVYSRAISPFPFTNYGLPAIISGRLYSADPAEGYLENLEAAQGDSLATDLARDGYTTNIVGFEELQMSRDQYNYPRDENPVFGTLLLIELSLTRLTKRTGLLQDDVDPGLKNLIELKRKSLQVMNRMIATDDVETGTRTLNLIHNFIPHTPNYYRLEDVDAPKLDWRPYPFDVKHYLDETLFFIQKLNQLMDHLRKIGVYEKSLIIVTGDHGHFIGGRPSLYTALPGAKDFRGYEKGEWARSAAMYNPAILIKTPDSDKPLVVSHDAVSVTDLRGVVDLYIRNGTPEDYRNLLQSTNQRENTVVVFHGDARNPYGSTEDHVRFSFSGNASSLAGEFIRRITPQTRYQWGTELTPANELMDGNWSKEEKGAWLKGYTGRMLFQPISEFKGPLELKIRATPLRNLDHLRQRVKVSINGIPAGELIFTETNQTLSIILPADAIESYKDVVQIAFKPLDARTPAELGLGTTDVPVSIFVYSVAINALGSDI